MCSSFLICMVCGLCLHIQFPVDMCTISVLYGTCACIFNSPKMCAQVLCPSFLICMFCAYTFNSCRICARNFYFHLLVYFRDVRSTEDAEGLTREYNLAEKHIGGGSNLP